jgi:hypothetical protein
MSFVFTSFPSPMLSPHSKSRVSLPLDPPSQLLEMDLDIPWLESTPKDAIFQDGASKTCGNMPRAFSPDMSCVIEGRQSPLSSSPILLAQNHRSDSNISRKRKQRDNSPSREGMTYSRGLPASKNPMTTESNIHGFSVDNWPTLSTIEASLENLRRLSIHFAIYTSSAG